MAKLLEFINGKKTYITGIATIIMGVLQGMGIDIPEWLWQVLLGVGVIAGRDAISKISENVKGLKGNMESNLK